MATPHYYEQFQALYFIPTINFNNYFLFNVNLFIVRIALLAQASICNKTGLWLTKAIFLNG